MASEIAIQVRNVSKEYRLYAKHINRLKETFHPLRKKYHRKFPALKDVSFDVQQGQTFGIVGRNGSGKSTLLKIIAGVVTRSGGDITINGKVSALFGIGTGFNPELTGLDNVYFNGIMMGYTRRQIHARVEAIADFADIGDYLYQPVRSYSSGMFARLAFAVAISEDPDVLVVDEVLSVGDEAFQRKCFARIEQIRNSGGTILFVSHVAARVVRLCQRAILLDRGELLMEDDPKEVVAWYQRMSYSSDQNAENVRKEILQGRSVSAKPDPTLPDETDAFAPVASKPDPSRWDPALVPKSTVAYDSNGARIRDVAITTTTGEKVNVLGRRCEYVYTYTVEFAAAARNVGFGLQIKTLDGVPLGGAGTTQGPSVLDRVEQGERIRIDFHFVCSLLAGAYCVNAGVFVVGASESEYLHRIVDAAMFRVECDNDGNLTGTVDFQIRPVITRLN